MLMLLVWMINMFLGYRGLEIVLVTRQQEVNMSMQLVWMVNKFLGYRGLETVVVSGQGVRDCACDQAGRR